MNDDDSFCPSCGQPVYREQSNPNDYNLTSRQDWNNQSQRLTAMPMKWFKFVIWVQLFLSALSWLDKGFLLLTGTAYGDYTESLYIYYGGLKVVDILFGLLSIAFAVAAVYVRFQLSGFKRNGPKFYLYLLLASIGISLVYLILTSLILGTLTATVSAVSSILTSCLMYTLSRTYFKKRELLFVN